MADYEHKIAALEQQRAKKPFWTEDDLLAEARKYVANGKSFLEKHVPGWFNRARKAAVFDMQTNDYCMLANSCKGVELNGAVCYSAGDVCRAFPTIRLDRPEFGFYQGPDEPLPSVSGKVSILKPPVRYQHLQAAWAEVLGRNTLPVAA